MKILALFAIMAVPPLVGSATVAVWPGPAGFVVALAASLFMLRDSLAMCMILMRHWQLFGRDLFLIEQNGRHRWVDAYELKHMAEPCRVRAQRFYPDFIPAVRTRHRE